MNRDRIAKQTEIISKKKGKSVKGKKRRRESEKKRK